MLIVSAGATQHQINTGYSDFTWGSSALELTPPKFDKIEGGNKKNKSTKKDPVPVPKAKPDTNRKSSTEIFFGAYVDKYGQFKTITGAMDALSAEIWVLTSIHANQPYTKGIWGLWTPNALNAMEMANSLGFYGATPIHLHGGSSGNYKPHFHPISSFGSINAVHIWFN